MSDMPDISFSVGDHGDISLFYSNGVGHYAINNVILKLFAGEEEYSLFDDNGVLCCHRFISTLGFEVEVLNTLCGSPWGVFDMTVRNCRSEEQKNYCVQKLVDWLKSDCLVVELSADEISGYIHELNCDELEIEIPKIAFSVDKDCSVANLLYYGPEGYLISMMTFQKLHTGSMNESEAVFNNCKTEYAKFISTLGCKLEVSDCHSCDATRGPYGFISIAIDSYPKHDDEYRETYTSKLISFLEDCGIVKISDDDFSKYIKEFDEGFTMTKPKKNDVETGVATGVKTVGGDVKTDSKNMIIESRISGMKETNIKKIHMKLNKQNVDRFNAAISRFCTSTGFELACRSTSYNRIVQPMSVRTSDTIYYIKNTMPPMIVNEMNAFFKCVDDEGTQGSNQVKISVTRDLDNANAMYLTLEPDEGCCYITDGSVVIKGQNFAESVFTFIWGMAQIPGFEVYTNNSDIDTRLVLFKEYEEVMFPKMMSLSTLAGNFVDSIGVPLRGENIHRINNFLNTADVILNIIRPHDKDEGYEDVSFPSIRIVCFNGVFKLVGSNHIAMDAITINSANIMVYIENGYLRFTNCASIESISIIRDSGTEKCVMGMLHPLISLFLMIGVTDVIVEHQYANIFNVN